MIPAIAETFLALALLFAGIQAFSFVTRPALARLAAIGNFAATGISFALLIYSFVVSDFSLKVVFQNSHTLKPMLYKISGTWGNHEGSLLMLLFILSAYNFVYALNGRDTVALNVNGGIIGALTAFSLFASNPFQSFSFKPAEGLGLNPVLQDIGLALHPPVLYAGYVGFSIIYSICAAALIRGKFPNELAAEAKKFCLFAWSFLTLGIGLGSWWAYRELGWGGFWFWDPVENCSLMPWLTATALLHCLLIAERKNALKKWSALLGIITFSLSVLGFFLVRSGVLMSVHSFASDPTRGIFILIILSLLAGGGLGLFGARAHKFTGKASFKLVSREGFILWNNLLLSVLAVIIVLGTLYPILLEAFSSTTISVGAPYYAKTFVPVLGGLLMLAIATTILWRNSTPMLISHIGFFVLIIGVASASYLATEKQTAAAIGEKVEFGGYNIEFRDVKEAAIKNYVYRQGEFAVWQGEREKKILRPESRYYPVEQQKTTESAIYRDFLSDLYIVIGDPTSDKKFAVRMYHKPFINLIWLGTTIIFIGGIFSLTRRFFSKKSSSF